MQSIEVQKKNLEKEITGRSGGRKTARNRANREGIKLGCRKKGTNWGNRGTRWKKEERKTKALEKTTK